MSFDGVFTHLIIKELNQQLIGGRINKIHQPYENEIILSIRSQGKNHKLLLSAHPSYARIQLTAVQYANPATPPNFIMMLRKYLDGAILESMNQIANDRIVHLHFTKRDELGDLQNIVLILEMMGRHSTIVLVNKATNKILDVIKHVGSTQNTYRTLLPGVDYIEPPKQDRPSPFAINDQELFAILSQAKQIDAKYLQQHFQGFGQDTATELAFRLNQKPNEKLKTWHQFFAELNQQLEPTLLQKEGKEYFTPIAYTYYLQQAEKEQVFANLNDLLEAYYLDKAERDRAKQQGNELIKKVENERKRNVLKLEKRQRTLQESENAESYRQKGELLTTYLSMVPKGENEVILANYYDENRPLSIRLNPALSPSQNAQKYFQRYQKLKNAVKLIDEQIKEAKAEIDYLDSVLAQLSIASAMDMEVIREELVAQGYLKNRQTKQQRKINKPSKPEVYFSSQGTEILVGKNNLQNDQLTLKTAKKTDYWFHTKDIPGSHVILKTANPTEKELLEAAELAAYFSKYRFSAQVPVDYVQVKYIKKPNGAKPGFVIYTNQKTLFVTPDATILEKLSK